MTIRSEVGTAVDSRHDQIRRIILHELREAPQYTIRRVAVHHVCGDATGNRLAGNAKLAARENAHEIGGAALVVARCYDRRAGYL